LKLLIDIGNTTTSVGLWKNNKLSMITSGKNNKLLSILKKYSKKEIDNIFFTSVISDKENKRIIGKLKKIYTSSIKQIKATRVLLGMTNGYAKPKHLGADRWATIVASFILYKRPLIIVDCGTAISIDIVNRRGVHLGGYILGGVAGYSKSFKNAYHLKNIKIKQDTTAQMKSFPNSTQSGIEEGYLLMVISAIENTYSEVKKNQKISPNVLVTGGNGKIISKRLSIKNKYDSDLVLKSIGIISNHQ